MPRGFDPLLSFGVELLYRHASQRRGKDFLEVPQTEFGYRLPIARECGLERLDVLEFRLVCDHRRNTFETVDHLRVHRMLDPERAVLVKDGDAILCRHVVRARRVGCSSYEVEDRLLHGPVVP
jgi:hypothetical protein